MDLGLRWQRPCQVPGRPSATLAALVVPTEAVAGAPGLLHGGMAATYLDECMAGLSHALDRRATVTATLSVRYRRPVPVDGRPLRVEAWRDRAEIRRRNRVHGRLLLADGAVAVEAVGVFLDVGPAGGAPSP